jgi:hypothetical protein
MESPPVSSGQKKTNWNAATMARPQPLQIYVDPLSQTVKIMTEAGIPISLPGSSGSLTQIDGGNASSVYAVNIDGGGA